MQTPDSENSRKPILTLLTALALLPSIGCSTDGDDNNNPGGDGDAGTGAAYLVGTRVWDDTSTTSYFHVVSSLEEGTSVDLSQALEVPGAAKLYAVEGLGWFGVGGGEEPTITRYTLGDDGRLTEGARLSLQSYGVQGLWDTLYVVSPTKMYYPDRDGQQLIVINPTEMAIEGVVALPETAREGYLSLYSYDALPRDNKLLFSVGWFDWETGDRVLGETGLVVLDTETDTVTRFDADARCGGITQPIVTESGDAYFVSSALAGAAYRLGRLSTEPCALRIDADSDAFDPEYGMHLAELTSGAISGEPVPAGGNSLFLRVFDESAATVEADDATWELTSQAAWEWWKWDLATDELVRMTELSPSTSDVLWFEIDGRVFGSETKEGYSETTLLELTAEGGPKTALTVPGFLHGVARIR